MSENLFSRQDSTKSFGVRRRVAIFQPHSVRLSKSTQESLVKDWLVMITGRSLRAPSCSEESGSTLSLSIGLLNGAKYWTRKHTQDSVLAVMDILATSLSLLFFFSGDLKSRRASAVFSPTKF